MGQVYGSPFAILPEWLIDSDVSDKALRVFAVLARHADGKGKAFPGRPKLAERAKCSTSTLDRALDELRAVGAITTRKRSRPDGSQSSNDYWLWPATPSSQTGTPLPKNGEGALPTDDEAITKASSEREVKPLSADADFEAFWVEYPKARRTAKPDARAAFKIAVKKVPAEQIIVAVKRYAADPNRVDEFTPYPQKWLKQERWNAPPEIRRAVPAGRVAQSTSNIDRIQNTILGGGQKAIG